VFSLNGYILKIIEKRNGIDFSGGIEQIVNEVSAKRNEIDNFIKGIGSFNDGEVLYKKFTDYSKAFERMILIKRLESGVSTLIFFIYSILGSIAGVIMSILALLTTRGTVGHIILVISILGGIAGLAFALNSMKKERNFIISLKQVA
jgi:multisubunit Na+/H+ antiporter MnhF subunit